MANRAFRRELSPRIDPRELFESLSAHHEVALWIDQCGQLMEGHTVIATGDLITLEGGKAWEQLRELWHSTTIEQPSGESPLGLAVVVPYDAAHHLLSLSPETPGVESWNQPIRVVRVTQSVSIDRATGTATAWCLAAESSGLEAWITQVTALASTPPRHQSEKPVGQDSRAHWREGPERYRELISQAQASIRDGEAYQLCLTTQVTLETSVTDLELYETLRHSAPAPYQALLRLGEVSVVSASPETFLRLDRDGRATTRPIKGTRPRGATPREDRELVEELVSSDKERAENLMIVDLMRNDLLRVCRPDSISVSGLFEVETYSSVHQLVSTVHGVLREDCDGIDLMKACFPAGSMTGAPKQRAVELLAQLESGPRGIYSGTWGWLGSDETMELAMTIRTAVYSPGRVEVGVGGGITWSSVPVEEIAEVGHKARRLLEALGVSGIQYS